MRRDEDAYMMAVFVIACGVFGWFVGIAYMLGSIGGL